MRQISITTSTLSVCLVPATRSQKIGALKQIGLACIAIWLLLNVVSSAFAQDHPAVSHNTWSNGAPMPKAVLGAAAVVLGNRIVVLGGALDWNATPLTETLVYRPASNTWSWGVPLPAPIFSPAAAIVNNILYVIGGSNQSSFLNTVWAFDPQTETWSARSPMPTARNSTAAVVENNIIYVIGGWNDSRLNNVESYDPATDTWTEEAPLLTAKSNIVSAAMGDFIVAADGYTDVGDNGDIEGYNPVSNAWQQGKPDPIPRDWACGGSIGAQLYVAGGATLKVTESFNARTYTWTRLADLPQATYATGNAVYKGKLYCFGGADDWMGKVLNNVQIYQP